MNNILKLKGSFTQKSHPNTFGPPTLSKGTIVKIEKIEKLLSDIKKIDLYWKNKTKYVEGIFFSVHYKDIVPKTRRIAAFFKCDSVDMNKKIVGAKFSTDKKHIITYYVAKEAIEKTIKEVNIVKELLLNKFPNGISDTDFEKIDEIINFEACEIKKTKFLQLIVDANNVEKFNVEENTKVIQDETIVSIYETEKNITELMNSLEIEIDKRNILSNNTVLLNKNDLEKLNKDASYLIAMSVIDISKIPIEEKKENDKPILNRFIKSPSNEPTIGVIDKPFRNNVYFSEWVESQNIDIPEELIVDEDYNHGTGVTSIIVDGQNLNPLHDDGCGNFKVRHFGVAIGNKFSSFRVIQVIEKIIEANRDIKVWNLSLGSDKEIDPNFISPEAAFLDELQTKYDVIFVIAGTNIPKEVNKKNMKIGAPADSINSLVVNAVDKNDNVASYSREGEVLSFYIKPDVSYFGGDNGIEMDCYMNICDNVNVEHLTKGTSYSTPWISRKLAYLIHILGFSREEAKALIVDSCEEWFNKSKNSKLIGHGVVPTHIDKIVQTNNDEIKFVISGVSEKYDTYNYQLPIPLDKEKYPFVAKATMCYFPKCTRSQGVDYTNTEFELKLGRLKFNKKSNEYDIIGINNDVQDIEGSFTNEEEARSEFRKWDNTKCIKEKFNSRVRDKKMYDNPLWGISIKTKNRINPEDGKNLRFGVVITLKEIHGKNRIDEFIHQCSFHKWFVEEVDIQNKFDIYNVAEEEIKFED